MPIQSLARRHPGAGRSALAPGRMQQGRGRRTRRSAVPTGDHRARCSRCAGATNSRALGTAKARESVTITAKVSETVASVAIRQRPAGARRPVAGHADRASSSAGVAEARPPLREAAAACTTADRELADQQLIARGHARYAARQPAKPRARAWPRRRATVADRVDPRAVRRRARHAPGQPGRAGDAGHGDRHARRRLARSRSTSRCPKRRCRCSRSASASVRAATRGRAQSSTARSPRSTRASIRPPRGHGARASFPNPDGKLRPGMLLEVGVAARVAPGAAGARDRACSSRAPTLVFRVERRRQGRAGAGEDRRAPARRGRNRLGAEGRRPHRGRRHGQAARRRRRSRTSRARSRRAAAAAAARERRAEPMLLSDISIKRPVLRHGDVSLMLIVLGVMSFIAPAAARTARRSIRRWSRSGRPIPALRRRWSKPASPRCWRTRSAASRASRLIDREQPQRQLRHQHRVHACSRDIESAANDVRDAVSRVLDRLPDEADPPQIAQGQTAIPTPIIWLNLSRPGDGHAGADRLRRPLHRRPLVDASTASPQVRIGGGQRYAMRVWLDRDALAARGLTVDRRRATRCARENVELPGGSIESDDARLHPARRRATTRRRTDFAQLPLGKGSDGYVVRLGDVAQGRAGSAERRAYYRSNGKPQRRPGHRQDLDRQRLDVASGAKALAAQISKTLPQGHAASSPTTAPCSSTPRCTRSTRPWPKRSCWCCW